MPNINLDSDLIKNIRRWCKDFERTQPGNLEIDDDTFEGSAYGYFQEMLYQLKK